MGSLGPDFFIPTELPPAQIGLLQGILTGSLRGFERDLQRGEQLPDPQAVRREAAAYARVLNGLEQGLIAGPDKDAHEALVRLIADTDEASNYAAVVAEHDAIQGLIHRFEGRGNV